MSVNVEDRDESKVEYLETARQISKRTAQMVANGPHKYMGTYGDHLMRCSLQMFTHADIANSIYVTCQADFEQRRKHLLEARGMCFSIESTAKLYTDLVTAAGTVARDKAYGRLADIREKSCELGLSFNEKVTKVRPLKQGFRYLKKRVSVTETGRIVMRPQRESAVRERRRIRHNIEAVLAGDMRPETERQSWESWRSHCMNLDAHRTVMEMAAYRRHLLEDAGLA